MQPATIPLAELCTLLHERPATFRGKLPKLIKAGFPRPLPHHPGVWSRAMVLAWIDQTEVTITTAADPVDTVRAMLENRMRARRAA